MANLSDLDMIQDGALLWVRASWLRPFVTEILPRLGARFVLITGDSDLSIPSESKEEAQTILNSGRVAHWYTQNYDGTVDGERISPIPIGIDFHTLAERPCWGETTSSPKAQEQVMRFVRTLLPPTGHRIGRVYVDFSGSPPRLRGRLRRPSRSGHRFAGANVKEDRYQIIRALRSNPLVLCQPGPLPRSEMLRTRGEYAFVLSPHGNGLDCHRTWEALAMGHIVIAKRSSLDPLYDGLPVALVDDWREITQENLNRWTARFAGDAMAPERLTNRYWVGKMRSEQAA